MRQISKFALLLAPVLLAAPGCATRHTEVTQRQPTVQTAPVDRFERLMRVASRYEEQGNTEVARRLYEQILAQSPEHRRAQGRIAVLDGSPPIQARDPFDSQRQHQELASQPVSPTQSNPKPEPVVAQSTHPLSAPNVADTPEPSVPIHERTSKPRWVSEAPNMVRTPSPLAPTQTFPTPSSQPSQSPDFFELLEEKQRRDAERLAQNQQVEQPEAIVEQPTTIVEQPGTVQLVGSTQDPFEWSKSAESIPSAIETRDAENVVLKEEIPETLDSVASQTSNSIEQAPSKNSATALKIPEWWKREFVEEVETKQPALPIAKASDPVPADQGHEERSQPVSITPLLTEAKQETAPIRHTVSSAPLPTIVAARPVTRVPELSPVSVPSHLMPAIAQLSSPRAEERIAGLTQLGMNAEQALPAVQVVRGLLTDPHPLVRTHAAGTLKDLTGDSSETITHLTQLLSEQDDQVIQLTSYLLGQIGPEAISAVSRLDQICAEHTGMTQLHAAEAMTRITPNDPQSFQVLKDALVSASRHERYFAAVALGGISGQLQKSAASILAIALHDEEADIRAAAALSLGAMGPHALVAIDDLEHMAQYDFSDVKNSARTSLACLAEYR